MHFIFANVIQDAFGPLITVFEAILVFIHDNILHGSWGFSIIGLTIVVRAVLVPLTLRQSRSMLKLQALAPEMKALQERYKEDKQRLNQEMMKLYQERGVNPFASCLPLLLQLPVFFSLFYMLRLDLKKHICLAQMKAVAASQHVHLTDSFIQKHSCNSVAPHSAKFLFIPDLTNKATGGVLVILIVLYIGSQLVSSLLMTVTSDRNQRLLALGLPFVFTIFVATFPAGLLVYWITTNVWTIGQQYLVKKRVGTPPPLTTTKAAPAGARALRPPSNGDKGSGDRKPAPAAPDGDVSASATASARSTPPPRPPRKKKKRSGRRR
jgi:YidC/Oxa1 family membrane protein insertase